MNNSWNFLVEERTGTFVRGKGRIRTGSSVAGLELGTEAEGVDLRLCFRLEGSGFERGLEASEVKLGFGVRGRADLRSDGGGAGSRGS